MPDLNVSLSYFNHRKTKRLVAALSRDADVLPIRLWAYVGDAHPETGELLGYDDAEIESFIGWRGQSGRAIKELVKNGWLEPIEGGYRVHDWGEHQGHLAAFKIRGKAAALARWEKAKQCNKHATSMPKVCLSNAPTNGLSGRTEPTDGAEAESPPAPSDAGIPTAKEIADYCSVGVGIPADYCEHYHATKTIQNGWVKNGLLIQWKLDIPRWWTKDRATWAQRRDQQAGKAQPEKQSIWAMQKQLEAIGVEMKKIERRGHEDPVEGIVIKIEDRAGYKLLKKRRDELNAQIAKGGQ